MSTQPLLYVRDANCKIITVHVSYMYHKPQLYGRDTCSLPIQIPSPTQGRKTPQTFPETIKVVIPDRLRLGPSSRIFLL